MGLVILFITSASFSLLPWTPSTIGYFGLLCALFMFPNSWLSNLIFTGFWWQGRWVFEFQNYDDSFSGWYMKLYKELLNFLAIISKKYSRIHIIIIENFRNIVPINFFDNLYMAVLLLLTKSCLIYLFIFIFYFIIYITSFKEEFWHKMLQRNFELN